MAIHPKFQDSHRSCCLMGCKDEKVFCLVGIEMGQEFTSSQIFGMEQES